MRTIPLTHGQFALVDDDVPPLVDRLSWHAHRSTERGSWYARARFNFRDGGDGRHVLMHRIIAGAPVGIPVDHRNRNGLDNQRHNLRCVTPHQNAQNSLIRNGRTGFKGVWPNGKRFCAIIRPSSGRVYLGQFDTPEEAARAYDSAAIQHFGEFAGLYFRDETEPLRGTPLKPIPAWGK